MCVEWGSCKLDIKLMPKSECDDDNTLSDIKSFGMEASFVKF